ncbi:HEAT repeat domain-containing protein [Candidatus Peregrinibacteria bacterium]|nr:HEAT repeat domain-containing protein [Candidatus Peregrinibacteria bacterium]
MKTMRILFVTVIFLTMGVLNGCSLGEEVLMNNAIKGLEKEDPLDREKAILDLDYFLNSEELSLEVKRKMVGPLLAYLKKEKNGHNLYMTLNLLESFVRKDFPVKVRSDIAKTVLSMTGDDRLTVREKVSSVLNELSDSKMPTQQKIKMIEPALKFYSLGVPYSSGILSGLVRSDIPFDKKMKIATAVLKTYGFNNEGELVLLNMVDEKIPADMKVEIARSTITCLLIKKGGNNIAGRLAIQDIPVEMKEEMFNLLIPFLDSEDVDTRRTALSSFGSFALSNISNASKEKVVPTLIKIMVADKEWRIQAEAADALGFFAESDISPEVKITMIEPAKGVLNQMKQLYKDDSSEYVMRVHLEGMAGALLGSIAESPGVPLELKATFVEPLVQVAHCYNDDISAIGVKNLGVLLKLDIPKASKEKIRKEIKRVEEIKKH